ncbi:hypothetical protein [Rosistilla oblonga]|uniref:hypothetical protein n=1 Tax=Rosistilla oblonga TaxID=2527990 RepID=UPI003A984663
MHSILDALPQSSPQGGLSASADLPVPRSDSVRGWILGPWLDLLLVSNLFWPLLILLQHDDGFSGGMNIQFWQIYFITTPHRWSTLALVIVDRQQFRERPRFFIGFALFVILVCVGVRAGTGTLTCLLAIDYIWNAWHFAAQHHGIYRIYGRLSGASSRFPASVEKWILRSYMLYCILRVAQVAIEPGLTTDLLMIVDWIAPVLPGVILASELLQINRQSIGRVVYLASVLCLFTAMLWSVQAGNPALLLALATASAWFHASEYLAVVGWRLKKQNRFGERQASRTVLAWIASRWAISLMIFIVVLGSCGWMLEQRFLEFWLLINVIAAFLHYGYDGVLWRKRSSSVPKPVC